LVEQEWFIHCSWQGNVEESLAAEEDEDDLCSEEEAAHCDTYFSHLKVSR
jgi:hypothetical protein